MGELINLRRVKKAAQRVAEEKAAAANRVIHGAPKQQRKAADAEKRHLARKNEAHRLGLKEPRP